MNYAAFRVALMLVATTFLGLSLSAAPTISFTTAKAKAAREGKVLLVDFTATWCMPCKWMDETTFADPTVLSYLRDNYVSIKIDIDDFDGFALKQQYNVETLPTLIFFSSDGSQIDRVEEGLSAADLLQRLAQNNRPTNRIVLGGDTPAEDWTQPFAQMQNTYAEEPYTAPAEYIENETLALETLAVETTQVVIQSPDEQPEALVVADIPVVHTSPQLVVEEQPQVLEAFAKTQHADSPQAILMFSLQAGAFSSQENALRAADHLRNVTDEPVLVEFDTADEKQVYRIYVGRFTDIEDAEDYSKRLNEQGINCIPRELAMR